MAVEAAKASGVPEEDVQEQRVMFEKVKSRRAGKKQRGEDEIIPKYAASAAKPPLPP